jgi:hypothetical protein
VLKILTPAQSYIYIFKEGIIMFKQIQPKKISLADIDLDKVLGVYSAPSPVLKPTKQQGLFIKGPVPLDWVKKANNIGGSTGLVATMLWFYVGLTGSKTIKLDSKIDDVTGLSRQTRQSILKKLERHGLIKLIPSYGAYPTVRIV